MDTLGYAKRLRDAGITQQQAEAHAEAARDFIMGELVTKTDLQAAATELRTAFQGGLQLLEAKIDAVNTKIGTVEERLEAKIDTLSLRLTVRLGGLLAAGIAILAGLLKLT
jgi:hypothetical protein